MSSVRNLFRCRGGAAAIEMVLVMPFLLALLFGSVELGTYFWSEHVLQKGMRDAAVFASRLPIDNYDCVANPGGADVADDVETQIKTVARTGVVSGGTDRLPLWDADGTTFEAKFECTKQAGPAGSEVALDGLYKLNAGGWIPIVKLSATLPYKSLFSTLGLGNPDLTLGGQHEAAVVGA